MSNTSSVYCQECGKASSHFRMVEGFVNNRAENGGERVDGYFACIICGAILQAQIKWVDGVVTFSAASTGATGFIYGKESNHAAIQD